MTTTVDLRGAVESAVAEAGLPARDWDSLDVLLLLTLVEARTGLAAPDGSFAPGDLADVDDVVELLAECGVLSDRRARLTVRWDGGVGEDDRRAVEYRANLACPGARVAIRRSPRPELVALAPSVELLPLTAELRVVLGAEPAVSVDVTPAVPDRVHAPDAGARGAEIVTGLVQDWVVRAGGVVWAPPPGIVEVAMLDRLGFLAGGAEQLIRTDDGHALVPAVCFPLYDELAARYAGSGLLVTVLGQAFRREPRQLDPLGRLRSFHVQEVVWMGDRDFANAVRQRVEDLGTSVAEALGVSVSWHPASDAFFLGASASEHSVKREAVADVRGRRLAVASVNDHGRHFAGAVRTSLPDDVVTGCAGFGIERLLLAAEGR